MGDEFSSWRGTDIVFNGAYVFDIDLDEITVRGKITHFDNKSKYGPASEDAIGSVRVIYGQNYTKIANNSWEVSYNYAGADMYYNDPYYKTTYTDKYMDNQPGGINYNNLYDYQYQIQRSLYMDDTLYTISNAVIKANDLLDLDQINSVKISEENYGYDYPIAY